ncbi:MAG: dephospho-CoA kinase, partial [Anaerolineales bacterium]|nr:dephospho-CoA kinase [Anaerolineales bacterium]
MSTWSGKYVIGLTGNIATGKSVVRRMLEHLGAYGIDADALGHRAISKGAPAYQPVLDTFGKWILSQDGEIDRTKLARIVFADPDALARLEAIVHPHVIQAVDLLTRRSQQKVIVIEAIKLLETSLRTKCDSVWVTFAPENVQIARLVEKRAMDEKTARQRVAAQPPQEGKVGAADVIIRNDGSFDDTWQSVTAAWLETIPVIGAIAEHLLEAVPGRMVVMRAGPRQAGEIAAFITRLSNGAQDFSREDVMATFGEKAYLMLKIDDKLVGLVGWQVENLVARTGDFYLEPDIPLAESMRVLTEEVERASRELQCEIALIFLPPNLARKDDIWRSLGYQERSIKSLRVRAWQEAAAES